MSKRGPSEVELISANVPLNRMQERLLVGQAQRGDSVAFRFLVKSNDVRLMYFIRRFILDEHRAADLLQDSGSTSFEDCRD